MLEIGKIVEGKINKYYEKYKGQFKAGQKNGHGIQEDKDGNRFEGEFRDGIMVIK